jgi:hypothetical protein
MSAMIFFTACEKENRSTTPIQIITDKTDYSTGEMIKVEVTNISDSLAMFYKCSSYDGIPVNIYKLEGNSWGVYWAPICDGFSSFCCLQFLAGESYNDTLDLVFNNGTYRMEYQFIVRPGNEYESFFSNSFSVE